MRRLRCPKPHRLGSIRPFVETLEDRTVPSTGPELLDPNLSVQTVVEGLTTPTSMAFLGPDEFFVLEKNTGKVQHVVDGEVQSTPLDLAVNFASERGLLGIALHPDFESNGFVYLYWTSTAPAPPASNPFVPTQTVTPENQLLESAADDTNNVLAVPLLGNRVDRFIWNGTSLTFDQNIITLRAFQNDGAPTPAGQGDTGQNPAGNHDGGVIRFGPDGKLYIIIGDVGRRGQLQNLEDGPTPPTDDDQFGGPEPDDAHLTGVILRLNDDGTSPEDNPFFDVGEEMGGEVGENLQKIFAYGIRNSFGMAFDPISGNLWTQENGDDSFDELNLVEPGMNGGWIQIMGPVDRIDQFKEIETSAAFFGLQQRRWSPENIADSAEEALERLFMLPGAHYSDPEFSWKFAVAPAAIGFLDSRALGPQYEGDLFVGASRTFLEQGYLFHFNLTGNRQKIGVDGPGLADRVADNEAKFDLTESESLLFGRNFGVVTDIQTGPDGNLYVVSLSNGAVYQISRESRRPVRPLPPDRPDNSQAGSLTFRANLSGENEVPNRDTPARGQAIFRLSPDGTELNFRLIVANIENVTAAHIHLITGNEVGPPVANLFTGGTPGSGRVSGVLATGTITVDDLIGPLANEEDLSALIEAMLDGQTYVNVHTNDGEDGTNTGPGDFADGEIRGEIELTGSLKRSALDQVFAELGEEGSGSRKGKRR